MPKPNPAPEPPQPEPPKPEPPKATVYRATVAWSAWMGQPAVPDKFSVEMFTDSVQFGPLRLPIVMDAGDQVMLRTAEATVSLRKVSPQTWQWTLNGLAGQAYGTLER